MAIIIYDERPMLPRHRRRQYLVGSSDQQRPTVLIRLVMAAVLMFIVWYLSSTIISALDRTAGRKTAAELMLRTTENVQVSLQGEDWQRAESNLKLYAGDAIATRGGGDAVLYLFDGTRIRMDQATDVLIEESESLSEATSIVSVRLRSGRVWISSPDLSVFTGAILRTVLTSNFEAEIPSSAGVLLGSSLVNVVRSSGVGVKLTMSFTKARPELFIGEGQYFTLNDDAKNQIENGTDVYEYRDPVTAQLLRDEFLVSSFTLMNEALPVVGDTSSSLPTTENADAPLTVTSPENRAEIDAKTVTVAGRVNAKVSQLLINGQSVTIRKDQTFSVDVSLTKDPTTVISIEAQDAQGIPLSRVERTVVNAYKPVVEPVRIKSPVGSGETLTTSLLEVEITGEVGPNAAGIVVNDYRLQLFKPGSKTWSYLASSLLGNMVVGENVFTIVALDADGNKSPPRSITIVLKSPDASSSTATGTTVSSQPPLKQNAPTAPGTLSVQKPEAGTQTETSDNEFSIEGTASAMTYSISVNGYTLSLYEPGNTNWKYIASTELGTMKRGRNVYRIVSRNKEGEILDVLEYTVHYQP